MTDLNSFDETLYLQCREYIKLYLLNEELMLFKDYDSMENEEFPLKLSEVIEDNSFKTNLLLKEIYVSLQRLKS